MKPVKPVASVQEALELIDQFQGEAEDFQLAIPDALNDAIGINMAIVLGRILRRFDWTVDGYVQGPGYRIYRYKKFE